MAHVGWLSCIRKLFRKLLRRLYGEASVVAGKPRPSSRRSPARCPDCANSAPISPCDSSDHWLNEPCDSRQVGSRSVAMSQASRPSRPGGSPPATSPPAGSPPASSPPPAPAGPPAGRRRSALIAVACERCRKKKARVRACTVHHPMTSTETWARVSS